MRIAILNKSDSTGGAAVVSRRLMEALRAEGHDARMLVVEKLSESPFVELAASHRKAMVPFLAERLRIFVANGFSRKTLFKIDTASDGLPLWRHPLVKEADAVLLNWVNQGMLSLKGIERILRLGKPVLWTMHDMWNMTGICHHAGECRRYRSDCGECMLLGPRKGLHDLSRKVWERKSRLYGLPRNLHFVAVSTWLADKARESGLLSGRSVSVIPNAFRLPDSSPFRPHSTDGKIRLLFGAARLDDPIKGLGKLKEALIALKDMNPELASRMELVTFGGVKYPESIEGFAITHRHLGMLHGEDAVKDAYSQGDILVSASEYETLPGTLVEAQAYGCIPVSFDRGGQRDIVDDGTTGFLVNHSEGADGLATAMMKAAAVLADKDRHVCFMKAMRASVEDKFSAGKVAESYVRLIQSIS